MYYNIAGGVMNEGEFDDNENLYNGTAYGSDGNVKWTVVNGERQ